MPRISVIVTALNEGAYLRRTVEHFEASLPADSEIVVVDDGSTDGSTEFLEGGGRARLERSHHSGVAKARNRGAGLTSGEILVFADAHIAVEPGWWAPLADVLANPSVGAVAPAVAVMHEAERKGYGLQLLGPDLTMDWMDWQGDEPHPVPLLPGCCWAMRRETFEAAGGFDGGMIRWAMEESEMSLRLWLLGYELWLAPQVQVAHLFREARPYAVDWNAVLHNKLRLAFVHFEPERIARVVEALREDDGFASAVALTVESDVAARRAWFAARRSRGDAWFFERFNVGW
ncbi:MAG TPA: glycosyltransferase [Bryobacterales bacterium]|nr:glycosyltransferase [Bryobacterales bacterium]